MVSQVSKCAIVSVSIKYKCVSVLQCKHTPCFSLSLSFCLSVCLSVCLSLSLSLSLSLCFIRSSPGSGSQSSPNTGTGSGAGTTPDNAQLPVATGSSDVASKTSSQGSSENSKTPMAILKGHYSSGHSDR